MLSLFAQRLLVVATGFFLLGFLAAGSVRADIFKLKSGGEVRGELTNPDESPREHYIVEPFTGGQIKLAAELVAKVTRQRPVEAAYEKQRGAAADTAEDQWKLAQWCLENNLPTPRKAHLERVVALSPDHAEARRILGYEKVGERWMTRDEIMQSRGYVKSGSRWVLPQALELIKQRKEAEEAEREWFGKLKLWRMWLDGDKSAAARRNILDITDKAAEHPLIMRLRDERDDKVRELYVEALSNLGTPEAVKTVVELSLKDQNESFRQHCFDMIERKRPQAAVGIYVKALASRDNREVNRAAVGLQRLEARSAVAPLIDALITKHKFLVNDSRPGQMSAGFGRDPHGFGAGTGLGMGGGPKVIVRYLRNDEVLATLVKLTGQDFDYNVDSWKYWHAAEKKKQQPPVNVRRD